MKNTLTKEHSADLCPIQKVAKVLSDAWTVLLIRDLLIIPKRFCELEKSLQGISTRTLTLKLQKLVDEKIIDHQENYYAITKKGFLLKTNQDFHS